MYRFGRLVPLGFLGIDIDVEPEIVELADEVTKKSAIDGYAYHSLYSLFQTALKPSGTFGGGGPEGGAKSAILEEPRSRCRGCCSSMEMVKMNETSKKGIEYMYGFRICTSSSISPFDNLYVVVGSRQTQKVPVTSETAPQLVVAKLQQFTLSAKELLTSATSSVRALHKSS